MFHGVDISSGMIKQAKQKIDSAKLKNVKLYVGDAEHLSAVVNGQQMDMIYSFFGALNTVKDLSKVARTLADLVTKKGTVILTVVNRWYLMEVLLNLAALRVKRAFARMADDFADDAVDGVKHIKRLAGME